MTTKLSGLSFSLEVARCQLLYDNDPMDPALADLIRQLDLERLEVNLFRGQSSDLGGKSVFGGQVIGQALVAATRTVEDRLPHSLHGYFLLPGDMAAPIVYEVDRIRDGRTFSARRVQAIQHGRPILSMIASFQMVEPSLEHQEPMPQVPPPESLRSGSDLREQWLAEAAPRFPSASARRCAGRLPSNSARWRRGTR